MKEKNKKEQVLESSLSRVNPAADSKAKRFRRVYLVNPNTPGGMLYQGISTADWKPSPRCNIVLDCDTGMIYHKTVDEMMVYHISNIPPSTGWVVAFFEELDAPKEVSDIWKESKL
jgi:hypothetical protein